MQKRNRLSSGTCSAIKVCWSPINVFICWMAQERWRLQRCKENSIYVVLSSQATRLWIRRPGFESHLSEWRWSTLPRTNSFFGSVEPLLFRTELKIEFSGTHFFVSFEFLLHSRKRKELREKQHHCFLKTTVGRKVSANTVVVGTVTSVETSPSSSFFFFVLLFSFFLFLSSYFFLSLSTYFFLSLSSSFFFLILSPSYQKNFRWRGCESLQSGRPEFRIYLFLHKK